jgi:hypothetical protein
VVGGGVLGFFKLPCALVSVVEVHVVSLPPAVVVLVVVHVFVGLSHELPSTLSHCTCEDDAASAPVVPRANNDTDPSNNKAFDIVLLPVCMPRSAFFFYSALQGYCYNSLVF